MPLTIETKQLEPDIVVLEMTGRTFKMSDALLPPRSPTHN